MIGQIVGNYKIEEKLGEGGMGAVYRGIDMGLEREVAIKALRPELASQPQVVERFRSEAVTLAKLNHPNVATLYSFFRQGDQFYMVLEFVRGVTLDHVIQRRGALPVEQAVPIFCKVLEGIDHAHEFGIVHRDIKPANMMLTERGNLKVLDFGIARILGTARMTRQGNVIGTIEYMSPEQVKGLETDARSDIYSLGMLLYEMLTGRVPFDITNEFELMKAQIEQYPVAPRQINPAIPEVVEQAIRRAISKEPNDRFQSAGDFRDTLLRAGFAATGRLDPVTHGDASPYATRALSQPPLSNPAAGFATTPSRPAVPSQPGVPSHPGVTPPPPVSAPGVDPLAETLLMNQPAAPAAKETRIGTPGQYPPPQAPAAGAAKETRIGPSPVAPGPQRQAAPAFPPQPVAAPQPPPQQQSFFSRLTWVHYAGAGVAALVLLAVFGGGAFLLLVAGKKKEPVKPTTLVEHPAAPAPTAAPVEVPAQPAAPPADGGVVGVQVPAEGGAGAEKPAVPEKPSVPVASEAGGRTAEAGRPAAPAQRPAQPAKPKNDSAAEAARKRRQAALDALNQ